MILVPYIVATYDSSGQVDYLDTFSQSENDFQNITVLAGMLLNTLLYAIVNTKPHR